MCIRDSPGTVLDNAFTAYAQLFHNSHTGFLRLFIQLSRLLFQRCFFFLQSQEFLKLCDMGSAKPYNIGILIRRSAMLSDTLQNQIRLLRIRRLLFALHIFLPEILDVYKRQAVGAAVPIEVWKRRLRVLKSLGVNTIRASHNPMAEEFYDLCDEMGVLVIDELYDKWIQSNMYFDAFYEEWHERDLSDMIRRDANHPCIILWSVGNEVRGQYSEVYFKCLKELCDQARREDPTRCVSTALITFVLPDYNDTTPLGKRLSIVRRLSLIHIFSILVSSRSAMTLISCAIPSNSSSIPVSFKR